MHSHGTTLTEFAVMQSDSNGQFWAFSSPAPARCFPSVLFLVLQCGFEVAANVEREAAGWFPPFLAL